MKKTGLYRDTWTPLRIAFFYAFFSALWILFSDIILLSHVTDPLVRSRLQTYKGWFFILVTALLLFGVMSNMISRRNMILHELRESEEYNHLLLALSPIGLALCRMDGTLVDINSAYARIIGRSVEETLLLSPWDITPQKYGEQERERLKNLEETGRYGPYEQEYIHKEGYLVPVRLQGVVFERAGEKFIWSSIEDISAWKKAEKALRLSEEKFAMIFRNSPEAIALTSAANGQFIEVNESFLNLSGYSLDEISGHTTLDLEFWVNPADRQRYLDLLRESGRVTNMETDFQKKSGEILNSLVSGELIKVQDSVYILTIIRDITERKQAELELKRHRDHLEELVQERTTALEEGQRALMNIVEELNLKTEELGQANARLKELDRLKSMFIASMSHELRTPLNSIIGFTGLIVGDMVGAISDEQRDMLERVSRAGKYLLSLITDVIDIAKIESGKIAPYPENFDLQALVDEAVGQVQPQAGEKGLAIEVHLPAPPLVIHSDRKRLLQCLLNYLGNAVKFSEKGTVTVEVKTATKGEGTEGEDKKLPEGWIEISVMDTGIGIREEDMTLLFGSFVRLDTPLKATIPGTGLGLYLTRKLTTEVLGGTVGAESEEGKGSRFWLRIPMVSAITK